MSKNLDQIKLQKLGSSCQVTLFDLEGKVTESCDTLLQTSAEHPIFNQFDFLLSIQEVLQNLEAEEPLHFDLVEWHEQKEALFSMSFQLIDTKTIQWFIVDRSRERAHISSVQQSRNNAAINEELLEIRQKYLEAEKQLLGYKNEELLRIQKFKERFFAEVSHEMRTPLNSISGLVKLLEEADSSETENYLHSIKATSEHLNHIINDILDLSKIEEGRLELQKFSFDLREVVNSIIRGFTMASKQRNIYLKAEIDSTLPQYIEADPVRLSQVLYNLVGNAIKFTQKGGITIKISAEATAKNQFLLNFYIKDTGIGMSAESIQKILEPYAQVEGQSYYEYGGTGLGMGIAQRLIEVMGSKLSIESSLGKGTSMSFKLKCKASKRATYSINGKQPTKDNSDLSEFSYLFAEDDAMNALILKEHANQWKVKGHFVSSASQLKAELARKHYDILISDINLGDDTSINVLTRLRQSEGINQNIPIVFLSGDSKERYPMLKELRDWSFLLKPVNPATLAIKVRQMLKLTEIAPLEAVDLTSLKESAQHNMEFVVELIETILEHLPQDLNKLEQASDTEDHEAARRVLHKLKPSITYLGIKSLIKERQMLHDKVTKGFSIAHDFGPFKERVLLALDDLANIKESL